MMTAGFVWESESDSKVAAIIAMAVFTFFSWLEEEDYIIKSPMKRIHKVKTAVIVKDTIPE